jgi:chemotaxis protein MotC
MTSRTKLLFGWALASFCATQALGEEGSRPETKQPFEIVRSIQAIQDQIVRGNASAKGKLPKLIEQMAERLLASDHDVWRDPKNARAAVIYTLSGGQSRVIRKAIETGLPPQPELELMRGALAMSRSGKPKRKKYFQRSIQRRWRRRPRGMSP